MLGPAAEQFAFGAVPVFAVKAVLAAVGLPVGISEAGDLILGWGRKGHGWALAGIAARAANWGSCAGVGHGDSDTNSYSRSRQRKCIGQDTWRYQYLPQRVLRPGMLGVAA